MNILIDSTIAEWCKKELRMQHLSYIAFIKFFLCQTTDKTHTKNILVMTIRVVNLFLKEFEISAVGYWNKLVFPIVWQHSKSLDTRNNVAKFTFNYLNCRSTNYRKCTLNVFCLCSLTIKMDCNLLFGMRKRGSSKLKLHINFLSVSLFLGCCQFFLMPYISCKFVQFVIG